MTVVVNAWDAISDAWWDNIIPNTRAACSGNMKVQLLQAENLQSTDRDVSAAARGLRMDAFSGHISMGSSGGIRGMAGGGTLGGVINFKWEDGGISTLGVSNHHVIRTPALDGGKYRR